MVFKTKTQSAATSVKGKQTQQAKPAKKSTPVVKMLKQPSVPHKTRTFTTPQATYLKRTTNSNLHVSAFSGEGKNGIRIRGQVYLKDLYNFVRTDIVTELSNTTVYTNVLYVHPEILAGRVSLMSKAFNMYRFREICLEFRGNYAVTQSGEVFISYCDDPTMDPTLLQGRQIKSWMDTIPTSDSGPIYAQKSQKICADVKPHELRWYSMSKNGQDVKDIVQGKFLVAVTLAAIADFGELICSFDLELADDEIDVEEVLRSVATTQGSTSNTKAIRFPAQTISGTRDKLADLSVVDTPAATTGSVSMLNGVYSIMVQDPGVVTPSLSRAGNGWRAGVDFVGTIVQLATGLPVLRLFDSFADLASGQSTMLGASILTAANSGWVTFTRLLGGDGKDLAPLSSPLMKIKGFADHYNDLDRLGLLETKKEVSAPPTPVLQPGVLFDHYGRQGEPDHGRSREQYYTGTRLGTPM